MNKYATWSGDIWGGLAAMLVALPSAIAYGVAGFTPLGGPYLAYGAMAGVLGTVAIGLSAPALSGAPRLISAPCAPAAAVLASLTAGIMANGSTTPEQALIFITMVATFSAILQLIYGGMGSGRIIKYIPYPVVSGYLSGVGALIFLSQIPKFIGLPKGTNPWQGVQDPSLWNAFALAVGLATIVGMVLAPRLTKKLPAPIIGLMTGMGVYFALGLVNPALYQLVANPLLIGPINVDFSTFTQGFVQRWHALGEIRVADLMGLLVPAITLSVLLSIDTLKTCVVVDALTRFRHNSNRELIAQGTGNLISALVGGMPGAGTMGATLVSLNSGGQTRRAGLLEGGFALLVLLFFSSLIGWVPIAALAGILIVVAYRMVDWHSFQLLRQRDTLLDFAVIAAVVVVAVAFNLIAAAGAGVALAVVLFLREQVKSSVIRRKIQGGQISSKRNRLPEEKEILAAHGDLSILCELQGNLFFGTTDQLFSRLEADLRTCRYVILDMRRVQTLDFTAVHMLEQVDATLGDNGGHLIFCEIPATLPNGRDLNAYMEKVALKSSDHIKIFDGLDEALEWVEERILEDHREMEGSEERILDLPGISLFKGLKDDPEILTLLCNCVEERTYAAGETLFHRGDGGDELFLIRRGMVRIVLPLEGGKGHTLAIFGRGNFFGDMAFIDNDVRSSDAVTVTETDLYVLSRKRFDEVTHGHAHVAKKVFVRLARALAQRLRYTNAELSVLKEA